MSFVLELEPLWGFSWNGVCLLLLSSFESNRECRWVTALIETDADTHTEWDHFQFMIGYAIAFTLLLYFVLYLISKCCIPDTPLKDAEEQEMILRTSWCQGHTPTGHVPPC